jgi:hypothetical protein
MSVPQLLQIIREESQPKNQQHIFFGEISSINPVKVKTNNIELDNDQLKTTVENLQLNDVVLLVKVSTIFVISGIVRDVS